MRLEVAWYTSELHHGSHSHREAAGCQFEILASCRLVAGTPADRLKEDEYEELDGAQANQEEENGPAAENIPEA